MTGVRDHTGNMLVGQDDADALPTKVVQDVMVSSVTHTDFTVVVFIIGFRDRGLPESTCRLSLSTNLFGELCLHWGAGDYLVSPLQLDA